MAHALAPGPTSWPVRQPAEEAALLQRGDEAVDAGLGGEVQGVLHFVERRRDSGLLDPLMDEHEQLVLFACEHDPETLKNKSPTWLCSLGVLP
jgi:hypothetical protein